MEFFALRPGRHHLRFHTGTRIYVQEGERSLMATLGTVRGLRMGQRVEVTGTVIGGLPFPGITSGKTTVLGEAPLPEAPFFQRINWRRVSRRIVSLPRAA